MKDLGFFIRHPVFTHAEYLAGVTGTHRTSRRTADSQLRHHVGAGNLLRIRRGLYAAVAPGQPTADAVNPYLVAGKLAPDAVLAYHSALQLHGCAQTQQDRHQILTDHPWRPFTYGGRRYQAVAFPKTLRPTGQEMVGVQESESEGLPIRVTTLERTFVDVLDRPELSGGWVELWRSLENVRHLDLDQVLAYARLLGNPTLTAKVGLYLELHREELPVTDQQLELLRAGRPTLPQNVVKPHRPRRVPVRRIRRWNLIVPTALLERPWEDPMQRA